MTQAFLGKGTQLQVEDSPGSGTFTTYAEVLSISGPSLEGGEVDVTNMDSPGRNREFIAGLLDAGTITFDTNYIPSNTLHQQLLSDAQANPQTTRAHRIRFAQLSPVQRLDFDAFVQSVPLNIPVDSQATQNVTLRVTGAITPVTE